jgi:predicted DNA-binding transcriptional regulator AlpA
VRSLDKFYKYLENREAEETKRDGAATEVAESTRNGSRYVIRNGVTVAVPREEAAVKQAAPTLPTKDDVAVIEVVAEVLPASYMGDGDGAIWRSLPENVQRLAQLSADLLPDAAPQLPERRQLIERLLNPLLSLEDTARLLGVCTATVRRYANKGLLAHQRTIGQQRRFLLSDVLALMESRKSAPEEKP